MGVTETQPPIFEFTGNALCLDFVNTIHDRASDSPRELLNNYSDLVAWDQQAHVLTDKEVQHLFEESVRRPMEAAGVLRHAVDVREALFRIFSASIECSIPEQADLSTFNGTLSEAMTHTRIVPKGDGFEWDWADGEDTLEHVLWVVVRSAANLLTSKERDAVRICAASDCSWLFLDTSKNHSRCWCDMNTCGNRAKARRHYGRKKSPTPPS